MAVVKTEQSHIKHPQNVSARLGVSLFLFMLPSLFYLMPSCFASQKITDLLTGAPITYLVQLVPTITPAQCVPNSDGVFAYTERDYKGRCLLIRSNITDLNVLGFANAISSIKFVGSYKGHKSVTFGRQPNFGDFCGEFHDDSPDLGSCTGLIQSVNVDDYVIPPFPTMPATTPSSQTITQTPLNSSTSNPTVGSSFTFGVNVLLIVVTIIILAVIITLVRMMIMRYWSRKKSSVPFQPITDPPDPREPFPIVTDQIQATSPRRLRVFLCHSSNDKSVVRNLYQRLKSHNIDPWLDEENLLPGQDWDWEIQKAVRTSDVVIICLSRNFVIKEGFGQKEIKLALDTALEKPDGTIYLIPLQLEECELPERLKHLQAVNYFEEGGLDKLIRALRLRWKSLSIKLVPIGNDTSTF